MSAEKLRAAAQAISERAVANTNTATGQPVWIIRDEQFSALRAALDAPSTPEPEYDADGDPLRPDPHSNDWYDGYAEGQRDAAPSTPEPSGPGAEVKYGDPAEEWSNGYIAGRAAPSTEPALDALAPGHAITPECGPICWTTGHHHDPEACDGCRRLADMFFASGARLAESQP